MTTTVALDQYTLHLDSFIGKGKFGQVFQVSSPSAPEGVSYAGKVDLSKNKSLEPYILSKMKGLGAPKLIHQQEVEIPVDKDGLVDCKEPVETQLKKVYVMEMLGPTLHSIVKQRHADEHWFSFEEVSAIGIRCLDILEELHFVGFAHGDIKPQNLLFGKDLMDLDNGDITQAANTLRFIDFGLSENLRKRKMSQSLQRFSGSLRYASMDTHQGWRQSCRSDLESLTYMLVWILKASVPWQGIKSKVKEYKHYRIMYQKGRSTPEEICEGLPRAILDCLVYIKRIGREDTPDYDFLRKCLSQTERVEASENVLGKRKQIEGDASSIESRKLAKLGEVAVSEAEKRYQWVIVSNTALTQEHYQHVLRKKSTNDFVRKLEYYCEKGWGVDSITNKNSEWVAVLSPDAQLAKHTVHWVDEDVDVVEWCTELNRTEGRSIAHIAMDAKGYCIVSSGVYKRQSFRMKGCFPKHWLLNMWKSDYFITGCASTKKGWLAIATKKEYTNLLSQKVEMSFRYDSPSLGYYWKHGYNVISAVSAFEENPQLTVWILGKFKTGTLHQHCVRTSKLEKKLKGENENNMNAIHVDYCRTL